MPVNFKFPLDAKVYETDFEVLGRLGNIHTMCVSLAQLMKRENRTVLLLSEFGTFVTNPPVEVRVVEVLQLIHFLESPFVQKS